MFFGLSAIRIFFITWKKRRKLIHPFKFWSISPEEASRTDQAGSGSVRMWMPEDQVVSYGGGWWHFEEEGRGRVWRTTSIKQKGQVPFSSRQMQMKQQTAYSIETTIEMMIRSHKMVTKMLPPTELSFSRKVRGFGLYDNLMSSLLSLLFTNNKVGPNMRASNSEHFFLSSWSVSVFFESVF